jgi:hypothetical protein
LPFLFHFSSDIIFFSQRNSLHLYLWLRICVQGSQCWDSANSFNFPLLILNKVLIWQK